jgi:type IV pilus assembly protein PilX
MIRHMKTHNSGNLRLASRQKGVILVIALIVLVAMTLVALGTLRSVDTGSVVAGNLAFKQATLNGTDVPLDTAYRLLLAKGVLGTLNNDDLPNGYQSKQVELDWTDPASWSVGTGAMCINACAADANGNIGYYIINRMCTLQNIPYNGMQGAVANECHMTIPLGGGNTGSSMAVPANQFPGNPTVYYRITAKVQGPRNSVSIVQAFIAM